MATENNQNDIHEVEAPTSEKKSFLVKLDDKIKEGKKKRQEWKEKHPVVSKVLKVGGIAAGGLALFALGESVGSKKEVVIDTNDSYDALPDNEEYFIDEKTEQDMIDAMNSVIDDQNDDVVAETEAQIIEE